jgi:hypothetical protein
MRVNFILGLALVSLSLTVAAEAPSNITTPGFGTCAAYYFLAARGHGVRDYDRLYSAGEFALNQATQRHGKAAANGKMEAMSGVMMDEIHQDWRNINLLDQRYDDACETLLREAHYEFK